MKLSDTASEILMHAFIHLQVPAEWFGWLHYKTDLPPHMVSVVNTKLQNNYIL